MTLAVWDPTPLERETKARDRGMARAASAHYRDLALAREIARELAAGGLDVCADDVRRVLAVRHPEIDGNMNWMGSVFRGKEWEPAGAVKSRTAGSHGNRLVLWRRRK